MMMCSRDPAQYVKLKFSCTCNTYPSLLQFTLGGLGNECKTAVKTSGFIPQPCKSNIYNRDEQHTLDK